MSMSKSILAPTGSNRAQHQLTLSEQLLKSIAHVIPWRPYGPFQQKQVDQRLIEHELEIARHIQQSLLPTSFPALRGLGLGGFCQSARQVGGDFYDVLQVGPDTLLLVVADVMGKGVPAALFAATLRTLIRTTVEWIQRPAEILARINRLLFEELSSVDMFITAQVALADAKNAQLTIANAGHCPLLLTNGRGECRAISPDGMPLGILPHLTFAEETTSLNGYRFALLYTDGLLEARNELEESFGNQRLIGWLQDNVRTELTANELAQNFLNHLRAFQAAASPNDDQTFLLLSCER